MKFSQTSSVTRRPDVQRLLGNRLQPVEDDTTAIVNNVRKGMHRFVAFPDRWRENVDFTRAQVCGVQIEWVVARNASTDRRIVYCHGGGWVGGSIETSRGRAAALSQIAGASVLLVEYRLAPENPFPAGLDDCDTALAWCHKNGPTGISRASHLTLLGESAGAALAAALCARTVETDGEVPSKLVLLSGQLSVAALPGRTAYDDPLVTQRKLWHAYRAYTGGAVPPDDPRVSPLFTPQQVLEKFPSTLVQVSGDELFHHDARIFTARLAEARVRHVLSVWPEMPHSWHAYLDELPEAVGALTEIAHFIS